MKKAIAIATVVLLMFLLGGCGQSEDASKAPIKAYVEFGGTVKEYEIIDRVEYPNTVVLKLKDGTRIKTHWENVMLMQK